jgi:hypothetical protein
LVSSLGGPYDVASGKMVNRTAKVTDELRWSDIVVSEMMTLCAIGETAHLVNHGVQGRAAVCLLAVSLVGPEVALLGSWAMEKAVHSAKHRPVE